MGFSFKLNSIGINQDSQQKVALKMAVTTNIIIPNEYADQVLTTHAGARLGLPTLLAGVDEANPNNKILIGRFGLVALTAAARKHAADATTQMQKRNIHKRALLKDTSKLQILKNICENKKFKHISLKQFVNYISFCILPNKSQIKPRG